MKLEEDMMQKLMNNSKYPAVICCQFLTLSGDGYGKNVFRNKMKPNPCILHTFILKP